jgi:hypothetical protein
MWPALSDMKTSPTSPSCVARWASSGQRRPVEPPADAGLTRKAVLALIGGDRGQRQFGHSIDGRA